MDICRLATPLVKRIPRSEASQFALQWGRLLDDALFQGSVPAWSDFFVFPKAILWSPRRGGRKLAHQASQADLIRARMAAWPTQKEELWKAVVHRSRRGPDADQEVKAKPAGPPREQAVVAALRMGDVKKALQLLSSAPIAPKTEATLRSLKKLHPAGNAPAPVPPHPAPHFAIDVVRAALSTFGPGSGAGLFGYKPFLLQ